MSDIQARWLGAYQTEIDVRGVHTLRVDETPEYGGDDTGPMPTEMLLVAAASCMCLAVAHVARKQRTSIETLTVEVNREVDVQNRRLASIRMTIRADLPQEELEPLVERARQYCYVSNTLSARCPVEVTAQAIQDESTQ